MPFAIFARTTVEVTTGKVARGLAALVLALCLTSVAGAPVAQAQEGDAPTTYTAQVEASEPSFISVVVDGEQTFRGILYPDNAREFSGSEIVIDAQNPGLVNIALNGETLGILGESRQRTQVTLPPTARADATEADAPNSDTASEEAPAAPADGSDRAPSVYTVQAGDTLGAIAEQNGVTIETLVQANSIANASVINAGQRLAIPGGDGSMPDMAEPAPAPAASAETSADGSTADAADATASSAAPPPRPTNIIERMTPAAQNVSEDSPFFGTTYLTYYGRPNVAVMGILGEYDIDGLVEQLQQQAAAYDEANGPDLSVTPAFELVWGMATAAANGGTYLGFMSEETTLAYVERAQAEGFDVFLDVQIGALSPVEAIEAALPWLEYDNVHLAIDPEFAMVTPGQPKPGTPIGYVTGEQINQVQARMQEYIEENDLSGPRILIVHQFLQTMIQDKEAIDWTGYDQVELTLTADGWGPPFGKISKYNSFMNENVPFTGFKLFYRWDSPILTEAQALGVEGYSGSFNEFTPNLIIYQ